MVIGMQRMVEEDCVEQRMNIEMVVCDISSPITKDISITEQQTTPSVEEEHKLTAVGRGYE